MGLNRDAIDKILELGYVKSGNVLTVPGSNLPVALVPPGYTAQILTSAIHNEFSEIPAKLEAHRHFRSASSFVEYFKQFADKNSIILADPDSFTLKAIFDYHIAEPDRDHTQRWQRHTALLTLSKSQQLETWLSNNGKLLPQMEFAEFLQENASDIEKPSAGEMLTISRDLRATIGMTAVSNFNQQTGEVELTFKNEVSASAGLRTSKVEIPERFYLRLPLFANDEPSGLIADFRFRAGQEMKLMYKLYQVERLMQQRFAALVEQVNEATAEHCDLPILIGS